MGSLLPVDLPLHHHARLLPVHNLVLCAAIPVPVFLSEVIQHVLLVLVGLCALELLVLLTNLTAITMLTLVVKLDVQQWQMQHAPPVPILILVRLSLPVIPITLTLIPMLTMVVR